MAEEAGPPPFSLFNDSASSAGGDLFEQARTRTEEFLKRRKGEDNEAYSKRIAAWLIWDPAEAKRIAALHERCRLAKKMALVAVDLAEYRTKQGTYPEALSALGQPVLDDPFSGGKIHYEKTNGGFTLYSVGINGKDDGGKGDDIVIQSQK